MNKEELLKYRMPGEFEPHEGCVMIWPIRPGSWPYGGTEAKKTFSEVARAIAKSEKLWMLCDKEHEAEVKENFKNDNNVIIMVVPTDDAWARDVGPTIIVDDSGNRKGVDWSFNAWGGEYDGLYAQYDKDDAAAKKICDELGIQVCDAKHFVLEGGSIHSDGEGTLMVTEACLLSKGRNPNMSKIEIEEELKRFLGISKIIWLPYGIYNDETNEHVDNVCAFVKPGEVVLAWTDDKDDPQYEMSKKNLEVLEKETDAKGRKFVVHKLSIPENPVCVTEKELEGYEFEEGEDTREAGERLAASYVNFYISNGAVVMPVFGHGNEKSDANAIEILAELFPEREIIPVQARSIIVGGGNIHCITQQICR